MRHRSKNKETLKTFLSNLGYNLSDNAITADIFVASDHTKENLALLYERKRLGKFSVLFRYEPECVLPDAYQEETKNLYQLILSFGKPEIDTNVLHWPQYWLDEDLFDGLEYTRADRVVMVNANKLSLSKLELYTLRRNCVKAIKALDLYGEGWNTSFSLRMKILAIEVLKKPTLNLLLIGRHARHWFNTWPLITAPESKNEILRKYKYSLVIENDPTYMSEKLYDALVSGCIPVYAGPKVTNYGIPSDLVIEVMPTLDSVVSGIEAARKVDFSTFQIKLRRWLNEEETKSKNLGPNVMNRAISLVYRDYKEFMSKKF